MYPFFSSRFVINGQAVVPVIIEMVCQEDSKDRKKEQELGHQSTCPSWTPYVQ